ncbi:FtsK/SpoIIIE family DNA translocase [Aequorivita vladivostokensis]|uniref:Cell division protein FtsK n=1 Tax=Aequorivita vladivostokensis TaxID=171194 RepID=A0ABR5DKL9_9FLAO|nr:DNA translocase FtsK [Aequorivita vladivostokensis]KJJ39298.1 cell division protein FtsK [Aequorivita vladivostokensis]MAB57651.1 DNA translocase FtsK [Aequorivita sp.]MBF30527.1 DNA translocase FtsK [Aequorivita sp.]|tara:strand:- start:10150 stop:12510 length:2361 start_codon:yes stop_codon:yes gene_type:complete
MAKKKKSTTKTPRKKISFSLSKQQKILLGSFLFLLGLALLFSFVSYFFTWQADQSEIGVLAERELQTKNWLNKFGANVAHFFIYDGFGISAFIFAFLVTLTGIYYFFDYAKKQLTKFWFWGLLLMLWISVFFGFFGEKTTLFSGIIGFETNDLMQDYLGLVGAMLVMIFILIVYLVVRLKLTPEMAIDAFKSSKKQIASEFVSDENKTDHKTSTVNSEIEDEDEEDIPEPFIEEKVSPPPAPPVEKIILKSDVEGDVEMEVEQAADEEEIENLSDKLVKDFGEFDPKLELSNYKFPSIELLRDHTVGAAITIDQEELEENKNRIVETLSNYKIGIANIKATVGPTVTLYEIVPDAGIRISKIKNLEDDIALSLSALGIRIIAPIPGRGTIGIEVPNKNAKIVSMRSVIASAKFQNAEMELPIAFGKTISNETFVVDLAKMPHMLMAGATGQGKSVGLNAVLTSLLYKKHPAEVKFVLVDPKKVELTLFNKIERHYLAKLPDTEEAIITDTAKVINTLNSLCIEMDARYDLLKDAMVRNIKEYNTKFKNRKLNPNEGHRFLPYIVLVIDEFADLIMTAGKEVETPIARLAQLARAIGIHLIIATQRPSVNVITGIIKANFPARIAFRVTSKIDSRTILDNSGADQLIGRGDMLYTQGNELTRIQCAFVDTPEVADITEFIGSQKAYPDAHLLPEYEGEEGGTTLDIDIEERDKLFREAAEVLVIAQQGSASLLQRKLKLGYNRAGRIIDQMEAAGIVGPFEGSKARQVLVPTIDALNQLLDNEQNDN